MVPADLRYTKDHEWVKVDGDTATIGVTDFAASQLGDVVFVDLPAGRQVGRAVRDVRRRRDRSKAVSDLYAPVSGEVVEVNGDLAASPELVNSDPFGDGWMIRSASPIPARSTACSTRRRTTRSPRRPDRPWRPRSRDSELDGPVRIARLTAVPRVSLFFGRMVGRSLRQIVWARLRRDKVAMVCLAIVIVHVPGRDRRPVRERLVRIDPYKFDASAISDIGGRPIGENGGISAEHILGVEWGTGRDIFAQLLFGLRISLVIATSATFITVLLGTVIGIIAGYTGGLTDSIIGRLMDLILAFPFLLIILALSGVLTQRLTELGVPEGNPSRILYLILVLSVFGWPYLARIVRGQVLSLREREFVEAAVAMGARRRRILFTRDPAEPVGPDPGLRDAHPARVHRPGGRTLVPRRGRAPAGDDLRGDARELRELLQRRADVPVHPRDGARRARRVVQPLRRRGPRRAGPEGRLTRSAEPRVPGRWSPPVRTQPASTGVYDRSQGCSGTVPGNSLEEEHGEIPDVVVPRLRAQRHRDADCRVRHRDSHHRPRHHDAWRRDGCSDCGRRAPEGRHDLRARPRPSSGTRSTRSASTPARTSRSSAARSCAG